MIVGLHFSVEWVLAQRSSSRLPTQISIPQLLLRIMWYHVDLSSSEGLRLERPSRWI
jgi:hypothetical protein